MSSTNSIQAVRGMNDLLGDELRRWVVVEEQVQKIFRAFGFQEIRTPVMEKMGVFESTVGSETDIVEKQMYTLTDVSQEKLVLRPEGTASFIRAIIEHQLHRNPHVQRYSYYLPMYRHERPQKGRLRQFFQFGAELIQDPSPEADAEIIALLHHTFRSLGLTEFNVHLNSVGCPDCRPKYREELKKYLSLHKQNLCEQCQKRLERAPMRVLDCKNESCRKIADTAPKTIQHLCAPCREHWTRLQSCLGCLKIDFEEDPRIVRGLDYYVRTAFEFTSSLLGAQNALGGGGRYDGIATRFQEAPFPGVGYAFGMERLMLALESKNLPVPVQSAPSCFFAPLGDKAFERLYPLSFELKQKNIWVEMSYEKTKGLKWLLKQADRTQSRFALILGDDEIQTGKAILKDLKSGTQETLGLDSLVDNLIKKMERA